ncbi:MAG: hypothetical protein ACRC78_05600 [Planktothrix sp.]
MDTSNDNQAERLGGVEYLNLNPDRVETKRYHGIKTRLIELAAHDDSTESYIMFLKSVIENQANTIIAANRKIKELEPREPYKPVHFLSERDFLMAFILGTDVPKPIAAFLDRREARRTAHKLAAISTQPELFK